MMVVMWLLGLGWNGIEYEWEIRYEGFPSNHVDPEAHLWISHTIVYSPFFLPLQVCCRSLTTDSSSYNNYLFDITYKSIILPV